MSAHVCECILRIRESCFSLYINEMLQMKSFSIFFFVVVVVADATPIAPNYFHSLRARITLVIVVTICFVFTLLPLINILRGILWQPNYYAW